MPKLNKEDDYYDVLGVNSNATPVEITKAYKKRALKYHPDKAALNQLEPSEAEEQFKVLGNAYVILSDPIQRLYYNLKRRIPVNTNQTTHKSSSTPPVKKAPKPVCYPSRLEQSLQEIIVLDDTTKLHVYLRDHLSEEQLLQTILYCACRQGKMNIAQYMIEQIIIDPKLLINDGLSFTGEIFKAASESGVLALVKYLLEIHHVDIESQGLSDGTKDTALSRAAEKGHVSVVEYLITQGANLNPKISNSNILNRAISSRSLQVVQLLIEAGTRIEEFTMQCAFEKGNLDIIRFILQKRPGIHNYMYTDPLACFVV